MTDNFSWSVSAGRWVGIPVRVHFLLFLFIALVFAIQSNYQNSDLIGTAFVTSLCLVVCLLMHELAHVFALTNLGGHVNNIVFTPWGGNSDFSLPDNNRGQVLVHLAGPFFSGSLFAIGACLLVKTGNAEIWDLIVPFKPAAFEMMHWEASMLKIITWINFQLMFVNLIPCYPFDGVGIMRCIIDRIATDISVIRREATLRVIGQATGLTVIGCGWFLVGYQGGPINPVWFLFVTGGITMIFAARYAYSNHIELLDHHWDENEEHDYDLIYGDSSFFDFPEEEQDNFSQWLVEKQQERDRTERDQEACEAKIADEILKKLHKEGIESLSEEEKGILNRVSARIRRRREQGGVDQNDPSAWF